MPAATAKTEPAERARPTGVCNDGATVAEMTKSAAAAER
jgi:hypothetical protein